MNRTGTNTRMGEARNTIDTAVGWLLAFAGIGFGIVGFILGLMGHSGEPIWYLSAVILAILAVAVVLDESRSVRHLRVQLTEAGLGWLLILTGFGVGVVGFIVGLINGPAAYVWLFAAIILSILAVAVIADEGRRTRATAHGVVDEMLGSLASLVALGAGVVGFIFGLYGNGHTALSETWLFGAIILALAATAFMFDGERRAAAAAARQETTQVVQAPTETREGYRRPFVS